MEEPSRLHLAAPTSFGYEILVAREALQTAYEATK
jgi:hypothetical protein